MFVKITNGQVQANYTVGDLRKDNPNISFPKVISDEMLASYNVFRVKEIPAPDYNSKTHRLVTQLPELIDGVWTVSRLPVAKEQIQIDIETAQIASNIRSKRNKLLSECDWTQMPDSPSTNKEAWATYRQALRDITAQEGFPDTVTWPTKPTE